MFAGSLFCPGICPVTGVTVNKVFCSLCLVETQLWPLDGRPRFFYKCFVVLSLDDRVLEVITATRGQGEYLWIVSLSAKGEPSDVKVACCHDGVLPHVEDTCGGGKGWLCSQQ